MNLVLKLLLLCILLSSKSFAIKINPELANDSEDGNLVQNDEKIDKEKLNYKELMTFTYKELRDEVEEEMEKDNERRYQKALENKLAKLGLKEGDPGYDDLDVDYEEVRKTRLDTDPYYDYYSEQDEYEDYEQSVKEGDEKHPVEEKFDFYSITPLERQLEFEKSWKKILKDYLKDHYDNDPYSGDGIPDSMAESMLEGFHDVFKMNFESELRDKERNLALKYKGRKYNPTKDELKKIEDYESNFRIILSKMKKLQADASKYKYHRYW